ncbi:MAG: hypothetical protein IKN35_02130 [Lachnospiraceae bacterium]|nr:hypothetical protein [Lachnospiraceae bacterium]
MRIVIDIDEELYEHAINDTYDLSDEADAINAIKSGTELVTCKDCIWYKILPIWGGIEEDTVCSALICPMHKDPEDFCSKSRRRMKK